MNRSKPAVYTLLRHRSRQSRRLRGTQKVCGRVLPYFHSLSYPDLSDITWHLLSVAEICTRFGVAEDRGLDASIAARRLEKNGKNVISKPPSNLARKIFFYIFGGPSIDFVPW
jgi:hypothetical protein